MTSARTHRKGKKGYDLPNLQDALAEAQHEQTTQDTEPAKDTANSEVSSASDSADNTTKGTNGLNKGSKTKKNKGAAKDAKEPKEAKDQPAKADKSADLADTPDDTAAPAAPEASAEPERAQDQAKPAQHSEPETKAEAEAKTEDQPDEAAAKEAERQARIAKAKAQAKAFAEARAKERALKQGKDDTDSTADSTSHETEATATAAKDTTAPAPQAANSDDTAAKVKESERKPDFYDEESPKSNGANLNAMLAGFTLALFAALCVIGIITVEHNTEEKIQTYRNAQEQKLLNTMLPGVMEQAQGQVTFQCKLLSDPRIGKNMQTYLVQDERKQTLGLIANYSTSRGYSNPLILLAGVDMQGNVMRIEVKLSKETPGIGDKVEHRKGNYLDQFVGWNIDSANWEVRKFGGQFDYITGATVTSRAVVLATKDLLEVLKDTPHPELLPNCR